MVHINDKIPSVELQVQSSKDNTKKTVTFTTDEGTPPETNEAENATIGVEEATTETQVAVVNEVRGKIHGFFEYKLCHIQACNELLYHCMMFNKSCHPL